MDTPDYTSIRGRKSPEAEDRVAWAVAAQPHAGPPPTCPEAVLHTQISPRLLLHSVTISAAISPLFPSSGDNTKPDSASNSTATPAAGKEQKPSVIPL